MLLRDIVIIIGYTKIHSALLTTLKLSPRYFSIEYVRDHQDKNQLYNKLDVKVQLNIDMYTIATETASISSNIHTISLPSPIYINNKYTHHRPNHSIRVVYYLYEA